MSRKIILVKLAQSLFHIGNKQVFNSKTAVGSVILSLNVSGDLIHIVLLAYLMVFI